MGMRGIKIKVYIRFWLLFFLSGLSVVLLMVHALLDKSIVQHIDQRRAGLVASCEIQRQFFDGGENVNPGRAFDTLFSGDRCLFLRPETFSLSSPAAPSSRDPLEMAVQQTLQQGLEVTRKVGKTVGLFLLQHERVILTCPVIHHGRVVAAGGVESSLAPLYADFRRIQIFGIVFVLCGSFFFAWLGNRQLIRIYFMPLKRLAKRAETYQDDEPSFFSVRKEDNEFFVLSSALNLMLHRIAQDKRMLKETIDSLTLTNARLVQAQNDVIRAEKLASVGRLTAGIAHEIGNPIGIVLGYLDLLKQNDLNPEDRDDFIARSEKEITRINQIVRQLLDMSRSSLVARKPTSVHQTLGELVDIFVHQPLATAIAFDLDGRAEQDQVLADPDQLRQVFLNILLNAVDAVQGYPAGQGRIVLATEAGGTPNGPDGSPGPATIRVTITDNGPGIDPQHLSQVFEPFFTTKDPGKGTGLGLSVAFMIVQRLGGQMRAFNRSASAKGAVFEIVLPLAVHGGENDTPQTGDYDPGEIQAHPDHR